MASYHHNNRGKRRVPNDQYNEDLYQNSDNRTELSHNDLRNQLNNSKDDTPRPKKSSNYYDDHHINKLHGQRNERNHQPNQHNSDLNRSYTHKQFNKSVNYHNDSIIRKSDISNSSKFVIDNKSKEFNQSKIPCKFQDSCTKGYLCPFFHYDSNQYSSNSSPICRYEPNCLNKNCTFNHPSKEKLLRKRSFSSNEKEEEYGYRESDNKKPKFVSPLDNNSQFSTPTKDFMSSNKSINSLTKITCKFYPNCTKSNCTFVHPLGTTTSLNSKLKSAKIDNQDKPHVSERKFAFILDDNEVDKVILED